MSTRIIARKFFSLFRRGRHYEDVADGKAAGAVFVENRVIRMTRYAIRFMPPVAVFTLCWQMALGGQLGPRPWRPPCSP
ncbi:DUF412 family protein [Salmonella enterica subsp. enterica serovar Weltevreden]|nr:DUF412 family protein [Salmonella enterica subsp. enterica serovar Weltevreden]